MAARRNAQGFAPDLAEIAGWLHDLGKMKERFQARLSDPRIVEPHSAEGARHALDNLGFGSLLAQVILGHHAGLDDGARNGMLLADRLRQAEALVPPEDWRVPVLRTLPGPLASLTKGRPVDLFYAQQFLGRMVFSALVDADRRETAAFYARQESRMVSRPTAPSLAKLRDLLDHHMAARGGGGAVNDLRRRVHTHARAQATSAPGLFSLTVPTGGGKTLTSLGFALDHAIAQGMERVIFVIPYTSIVEQTAQVLREVFGTIGNDAVLEHHSAFDWEGTGERGSGEDERAALKEATETWDRPVIVTTAVQFFESLHARRGSPCCKLHRIANAVVVLDEAQTLPIRLLRPSLASLKELARGYRASIVFCTATQPALLKGGEDGFPHPEGLDREGPLAVRELAPDPVALYDALRRVSVEQVRPLDNAALAEALAGMAGGLAILNNRKQARAVFDLIRPLPEAFHLSTNMTARHRRQVLDTVRARLKAGAPVRLVSTSLIEAGVDISFPVVFRALAGLDSIAQAAGRCNREGNLPDLGRVVIFEAERGAEGEYAPPDGLRQMADVARVVLAKHAVDPLSLDAVREYFRNTYWNGAHAMDAGKVDRRPFAILCAIQEAGKASPQRPVFPYASIAEAFRIIEDGSRPVVIVGGDWGVPEEELRDLGFVQSAGAVARGLQNYQVQVPAKVQRRMQDAGLLRPFKPKDFADQFLLLDQPGLYDPQTGLRWDDFGDLGFMNW